MGRKRSRWRPWTAAGIAVVLAWVLSVVWRSASHRDDYATYGAFAVAVVVVFPSLIKWARRASSGSADARESLDRTVENLAVAVLDQWERAAGERGLTGADPIRVSWASPSLPVAGSAAAAVSSRRFAPLPGLSPAGIAQLGSGCVSDLHALYGGLGSGRLVVIGAPGSGKSGAAVLLIVAALRYRNQASAEDREKIPVPVLVTAQDWNPDREPVSNWLARRLHATYPQLARFGDANAVSALLTGGRIAVIIDGLDEIDPKLQPVALRALSQQASCRLVILSRTDDMAAAAARQGLQGSAAIELQPVRSTEAAGYLERIQLAPTPEGWHDLAQHLRREPASPLSKALDNPLALSLVRDTCKSEDDARGLLAFSADQNDLPIDHAVEVVTDYLLDRVLPAAYACQPGLATPPYDVATAQDALAKIAAQMNRQGTRDLYWWHISSWAPRSRRKIMSGIAAAIAAGLGCGFGFGLGLGLGFGLTSGFAGGLVGGLLGGLGGDLAGGQPPRMAVKLQVMQVFSWQPISFAVASGVTFGLDLGFESGRMFGLGAGLAIGLAMWLWLGLVDAAKGDRDSGSSQSPATSWRLNWNYAFLMMLAFGLTAGLMTGLTFGLMTGPEGGVTGGSTFSLATGLTAGLMTGLTFGLVCGLSVSGTWPVLLASAQIARRWRTPVRLMRFLEDAHGRDVLRTVGPAYQFRHARLQDRLADAASLPGRAPTVAAAQAPITPGHELSSR
jgi:hypothetical protein